MESDFMKKLLLFLLPIFLSAAIWPFFTGCLSIKAIAADEQPEVIINEIMYNPEGLDEGREWIEIYNNSISASYIIDNNWRFNDGSNHRLTLVSGTSTLPAGGYAIFASDANTFSAEYPDFSGNLFDTVMALNNTADELSLSNDAGEIFFSIVNYQSDSGGEDNGYTLERINFSEEWQQSFKLAGTPAQENSQIPIENEQEENNSDDNQDTLATSTQEIIDLPEVGNQAATSTPEDNQENNQPPQIYQQYINFQDSVYSDQIFINEIFPDPIGADNDNEFIELYNSGNEAIDLNGWQLSDSTAKKFTINYGNIGSVVIFPGKYFIIYSDKSKIALNNTGDSARLYQPNGNLAGEVYYSKAKPGQSYSRFGSDWQWSEKPTPNGINQLEQVALVNSTAENIQDLVSQHKFISYEPRKYIGLRINEFLPNPDGSDDVEWVELFNNSSSTLNLFGFALDDSEGGSKPYYFNASATVPAFGFLTIYKEESKLSLNNSIDNVRLLDPYGELFDDVLYSKAESGKSYNYDPMEEEWYWTISVTPDFENAAQDFQIASISTEQPRVQKEIFVNQLIGIKNLDKGQAVRINGVVIASLGEISSKTAHLASYDAENQTINFQEALAIYSSSASLLDGLKIGQLVELTGVVSEAGGQKRVNLNKSSEIIITGNFVLDNLQPSKITDLNEDMLGGLFAVSGTVLDKKSGEFYLGNDDGEIRVLLKSTGMKSGDISEGAAAQVTGILVLSKNDLALVPRSKDDLLFGTVFGVSEIAASSTEKTFNLTAPNRRAQTLKILIYSAIGLFVIICSLLIRKFVVKKL